MYCASHYTGHVYHHVEFDVMRSGLPLQIWSSYSAPTVSSKITAYDDHACYGNSTFLLKYFMQEVCVPTDIVLVSKHCWVRSVPDPHLTTMHHSGCMEKNKLASMSIVFFWVCCMVRTASKHHNNYVIVAHINSFISRCSQALQKTYL